MTTTTFLTHESQTIDTLATMEAVGDISAGSLLLLVADDQARLVLPLGIDDVPDDPPQHERVSTLRHAVEALSEIDQCAGLVLAVGRYGDPRPRGGDYAWHDAITQALAASRLTGHGTYVVTPSGVRKVRPQVAAPGLLAA
jgi:hypothetical protein